MNLVISNELLFLFYLFPLFLTKVSSFKAIDIIKIDETVLLFLFKFIIKIPIIIKLIRLKIKLFFLLIIILINEIIIH